VHVDETRRHHQPPGVDDLGRRALECADRRDTIALNDDVGLVRRRASTVDDRTAAD
jgi:hypothetical protein